MNFNNEVVQRIKENTNNKKLKKSANVFLDLSAKSKYPYNFSWLGRPIIQYPQDIIAIQEIIWKVQPNLIIETGIAHGGSLILSASMLELNCICGGPKDAKVVGIDIDIREHNRIAIEKHPLYHRINMIQGSSVDNDIATKVKILANKKQKVLVFLDSMHTHEHVLAELNIYAPMVSVNSYCVVFDTLIEDMPENTYPDRPWSKGNNPKTAVYEYLKTHSEFKIDKSIQNKLLITVAPDGYLKRIK
ncbi:MAG: cephalosporin hydroxylase family protein [bacterium]